MKLKSGSGRAPLIVGIFFLVCVTALFVHDAKYIFTGNTVDLNEIIAKDDYMPRDKYVTYTIKFPLGKYGTEQSYYGGIIPVGGKSYNYAVYDESGAILSVKVKKKSLMDKIEAVENGSEESITVTGCLVINSSDMDRFLEENCGEAAISNDVVLTSYVIDTTKTRFSLVLIYTAGLAIGIVCIWTYIRKRRI